MNSLEQAEKLWARVCFDPKFKPRGRYQTYRELVVGGLEDAVRGVCPVARSILSEKEWHTLSLFYLEKAPPQSHILREVAYEFAKFLKTQRHPLTKKYPYLGELIEYEVLEIKLRFAQDDRGKTPVGKIRLNPAHALANYRWPVHYLSEEFSDPKKIPQGDFSLLLWREVDSLEIKFMEVNSLVASMIQNLEGGPKNPMNLLRGVAKEHGLKATPEFLSEGRSLIEELIGQQILLR